MHEPSAGYADLPSLFRPRDEGGLLERTGVVDLSNAVGPDGRTDVPTAIANGVWVVVTTDQPLLQEDLAFYGLPASPDHRYAAFWRPYHLCGVETPLSIAEAALFGTPTAAPPAGPVADVVAVAKRDLRAGERLDGEGGYCVWGRCEPASTSVRERRIPIGLADQLDLARDVVAGHALTWDDVREPPSDETSELRAAMVRSG